MATSLPGERRTNRILAPRCPECRDHRVMVVSYRTPDVVYFRCETCGHTEHLRKPGWRFDNDRR